MEETFQKHFPLIAKRISESFFNRMPRIIFVSFVTDSGNSAMPKSVSFPSLS